MIKQFFEILYPSAFPTKGFVSFWELPGKSSKHVDTSLPAWHDTAATVTGEWDAAEKNVFYGVCLRGSDLGSSKRGAKKDIVCVPGVWADFDIAPEGAKKTGHAAKDLPPSVAEIISKILVPFGISPSLIVHSGGGLHAYWLFTRPLEITSANREKISSFSKAWQDSLVHLSTLAGWHLDMTADLSRVLRPAGTHNRKLATPRPVKILMNSGQRYELEALQAHAKAHKAPEPAPATETESAAALETLTENEICDLGRAALKRLSKHVERKTIISRVLKGEPFAAKGERDLTLQKVASWLGFARPDDAPETLAEILRPSLETMEEDSPDDYLTVDDAVRKIERAQNDARVGREAKAEENQRYTLALSKGYRESRESSPQEETPRASEQTVVGNVPPDTRTDVIADPVAALLGGTSVPSAAQECTALAVIPPAPQAGLIANPTGYGADTSWAFFGRAPYTMEELQEIAHRHALVAKEPLTMSQWKRRWIIQAGEYFYIFGPTPNGMAYQKPIQRGELDIALIKDLSLLPPVFFNWFRTKADPEEGETRKKTSEVVVELGSVARGVIASMNADKSYFDSFQQRFIEVACPLRTLEPVEDERVAKWLSLLGGESEGKLLDWLATITKLTLPSCALMITGVKDAGKSMLAAGCARLWTTDGPTKMDEVFAAFNADLQKCPLVVADEAIPEINGHPISTKKLRDLISSSSRPLHRKFLPNATLEGCLRIMFLANNDDMLKLGDENLGPDALAAVAGRFLHIDAGKKAADYLESIGGRQGTTDWVDGDVIAKHVLWLVANRQVVPGNRFLVEGVVSKMTQKLAVQGTVSGLVTEALARYLAKPADFKQAAIGGAVLLQDGKLLVNGAALLASWTRFISSERTPPTLQRVNTALAGISVSKEQRKVETTTGQRLYWEIDAEVVILWSHENGLGDVAEMRKRVVDGVVNLKSVPDAKEPEKAAPASAADSIATLLRKG
jgi:hypothetical protein